MIDKSPVLYRVAVGTHKGHIVESVVLSVPVFVVESEYLGVLRVPAPIALVDGDTTPLVRSLEPVCTHRYGSSIDTALAAAKSGLIGLTSVYGKFSSALLACLVLRRFESLVPLFYLAIGRAINLRLSSIYSGIKLLATYWARLFSELNLASVECGVALVGAKSGMADASRYNPKTFSAFMANYSRPFSQYILTSDWSTHSLRIQSLYSNVNTEALYNEG